MTAMPGSSSLHDRESNGAAAHSGEPTSLTPILSVWVIIQALAILLGAFRVPMWAHAPQAAEYLSLRILYTVQILGGAVLLPRLLATRVSAGMAICLIWPFALLAGFLGSDPISTVLTEAGFATAWLAVASVWAFPLSSTKALSSLSAFLTTWAAAGPLLLYFRAEFASPSPVWGRVQEVLLGPLILPLDAGFSVFQRDFASALSIFLICGGGVNLWRWLSGRPALGNTAPLRRSEINL